MRPRTSYGLEHYRERRDFRRTPEPGAPRRARRRGGDRYVIQKHGARRLHYDLRLELDGVLLSWAVPKGPSLDPRVKRLAMQTEDHPVEYANFEGVIPKGEYGAGAVMVWDNGRWKPLGDAHDGYRRGHLEFLIEGRKLRGRWHLVRTPRSAPRSWLLFKGSDLEARPGSDARIVEEAPNSVLTERTLEQIGQAPDRVWHSKNDGETKARRAKLPGKKTTRAAAPQLTESLPLSHPHRVLYPESKLSKLKLAEYYATVARFMLPHVVNRPLTLVRCPEGRQSQCFYQKHWSETFPRFLQPVSLREGRAKADYIRIADLAGLLSLVQIGTLEIHTWGASVDDPEHPDQLVFDLDPDPELSWSAVIAAAWRTRERLADVGLRSFVKTTGGKGLHVVVPIVARDGWDETKDFCRRIAGSIVADAPHDFVATMAKSKRRGKVFLDYFRNSRGATAIAPYSTRARIGAPVATPLTWEELDSQSEPGTFDVGKVLERMRRRRADPWRGFFELRQRISAARLRRLEGH